MELTNPQMMTTGSTVPVVSMKACVVYDSNGHIHHHHHVMTLAGGREPAEDEIAKDALQALRERSNPPSGDLHVLHIKHDALKPGKRYRVNVHKKHLVDEE